MGNALRFLYQHCYKPHSDSSSGGGAYSGPHQNAAGVAALARDVYHFEVTSQVPEGLSQHVSSSKKAQANWYRKLGEAWRDAKPPPRTPEETGSFVVQTLKGHQKVDVEGLLVFYGLPHPNSQPNIPIHTGPPVSSLSQGVKFELQSLPIDPKSIADGDTVTVYVSTEDPRESSSVPREVQVAHAQRAQARARRDYPTADAIHKQIVESGYRVISVGNGEDVLARKYRIRLRGIDSPESKMPYGKEAKEALSKLVLGKCLRVLVYDQDRYGRCVGDIYSNGVFVQEVMLKKGFAWHYSAYDKRPELAKWESSARAKRVGLWASANPEKPWEYRKDKREGR